MYGARPEQQRAMTAPAKSLVDQMSAQLASFHLERHLGSDTVITNLVILHRRREFLEKCGLVSGHLADLTLLEFPSQSGRRK
jgi:hypothetical protein